MADKGNEASTNTSLPPPPPYNVHDASPGNPSQQQVAFPTSPSQPGYQAPPCYPAGSQPPPGYPAGSQPMPGYPAGSQPTPGYQMGYYPAPPGYSGQPIQGQVYHGAQTTQGVIITQPGTMIQGVVHPMQGGPPDYQGLAWFACLCCCWPLGLVAIFKSNEVRNAIARGDIATANMASRSARTFSHLAIGLGVVFLSVYVLLLIIWILPLLSLRHY